MTPPDAPGGPARHPLARPHLVAVLLLILAGGAVYANSIRGAFVLDDLGWVLGSRYVRGEASWLSLPAGARPLVQASLRWNYDVNFAFGLEGRDPRLFHVFNIAVHLLAGVSLFGLITTTLGRLDAGSPLRRHALPVGFAAALVWLVHPLTTQAVTYVVQRSESMMGMFCLLSLLALGRSADERGGTARQWGGAAVVAGWAAMASKEVAVVLPAVALLYDRAFLAGSWGEALRRRWGVYALWGVGSVVLVWLGLRAVQQADATAGYAMAERSWLGYVLTQPTVILRYLWLSVWPARLVFDYEERPVASLAAALPGIAVVGAMLVATAVLVVRRPRVGFLPAAFFLVLAPTSSVLPIADLMAEHRMYLPLAAVVVMVVLGVARLLMSAAPTPAWAWGGAVLLAGASVALGLKTADRNRDYHSAEALWRDTVAKVPENARAHHNLANVLYEEGRPSEAVREYEAALRIEPGHAQARVNLAIALSRLGRGDEAKAQLEEVISHLPNYAPALDQLGIVYAKAGDLAQAEAMFTRAIASDPASPLAYAHLGDVLRQQGRTASAAEAYTRALELGFETAGVHNSMGICLASMGRVQEALHHFAAAVSLDPDFLEAQANLAKVQELLQAGERSEAPPAPPSTSPAP